MPLSMWTIFDRLVLAGFEPEADITDGSPRVSGLRLGRDGEREDAARVFSWCESAHPEKSGIVIACGPDSIFVPGGGLAEVHSAAAAALEFFPVWENRLLMCLVEKKTLQDLLDIAHEIWRRPMFIKSDSSWVFAISEGYDSSVHPAWEQLLESAVSRTPDFDAVRAVSLDKDFQTVFLQKHPVIIKSPFYGSMILRTNVWLEGQRVCEIVVIENGSPFGKGDVFLMQRFSEFVAMHINGNRSEFFTLSGLSGFFADMLDRGGCAPDNISTALDRSGWDERDSLTVLSIETKSRCETPMLGVLRDRLFGELRNGCVVPYSGRIVCVINASRCGGYVKAVEQIRSLVPDDGLVWGLSYEYTGLEQTPVFYRQSLGVLETAVESGKAGLTMYQAARRRFSERMEELDSAGSYVHPDLLRLREHDQKSDSQYLRTLFEFLLSGGNYTNTANRLGLHRNSLIYRMNRIEQLITTDLSDRENVKLMLLSFFILGVDSAG